MRFDWYAATIDDSPQRVLATLSEGMGAEIREGRPMHGYTQGFEMHHPERGIVARVVCGGNRGANPNAWSSGEDTPGFVRLVRSEWQGRHLVSRLDSAQDFSEPGVFDRVREELREVAKARGMKFPAIEDPLNPEQGRMQYIGSRKSRGFGRLYEKGKQLLEQAGASWVFGSGATVVDQETGEIHNCDHLSRLELVVRPEKEGRELAASCTPEQAWGFFDWSQEVAKRVMDLELQQVYIRHRKGTQDDVTLAWMCQQYRHMLTRLLDRSGGSWCAVGDEIGRIVTRLGEGQIH